ncbi:extracellular solute-binding protein [Propioniciclava coleopterorum]|uniref:Extracellular solute-binding protein n=1 Tax=Propioniciclava coleopterorum TaxID=2714937 RepID=A0A6G7Y2Q2_9ACTN|nr:extracellular solute-binding protein [Propioniciclava coleopterorum]QIK71053.1 extracellular solute-binding protein [Propioniciclava coleopterorum]
MPTPKKLLAVALSAALGVSLAACGGAPQQADTEDLATITVMGPVLDQQAPAGDGILHKKIEEFTGKKLAITWVPNSAYGDRTNVTLAADNIPEVMVIQDKAPGFVRSAQAGAFWDLTEKLNSGKWPHLKAENEAMQLNASINGKNYGVPRLRDPMRTAVIIRKDWLDKLGLQMPETTEDLYEIAKAFTTQDPDGNGKADTYGLILPKWGGYQNAGPYDVMETWYGAPNGWGEKDGKLVPTVDTPEALEAAKFFKKLVDEKLVNPDYASMDATKWNDPFVQGKGGIIIDVSSRAAAIMGLFKQQDAQNFASYVDMTGNLKGPDGEKRSYPTLGYAGFLAISRQSVPTEAELDDILTTLDKLASKEGQILENNGIQDVSFKVDGDWSVTIKGGDADVINADTKSFAQLGTNTAGYEAYTVKPSTADEEAFYLKRLAIHEEDMKTAVHNPANALVSETFVSKGAQLNQILVDARLKFIAGQFTEDQYNAEVKRWHAEGGDQVIKEMNELYAKR